MTILKKLIFNSSNCTINDMFDKNITQIKNYFLFLNIKKYVLSKITNPIHFYLALGYFKI